MERDINKFLFDVLESITIIESHWTNIVDYSSFSNNLLIQDAVHRRLGIIGEAVWQASKINSSVSISHRQKIISFRHILIHDYDMIELPGVWLIITKHLPLLKQEVESLLNK